jgi:hypothetical protein
MLTADRVWCLALLGLTSLYLYLGREIGDRVDPEIPRFLQAVHRPTAYADRWVVEPFCRVTSILPSQMEIEVEDFHLWVRGSFHHLKPGDWVCLSGKYLASGWIEPQVVRLRPDYRRNRSLVYIVSILAVIGLVVAWRRRFHTGLRLGLFHP